MNTLIRKKILKDGGKNYVMMRPTKLLKKRMNLKMKSTLTPEECVMNTLIRKSKFHQREKDLIRTTKRLTKKIIHSKMKSMLTPEECVMNILIRKSKFHQTEKDLIRTTKRLTRKTIHLKMRDGHIPK